MNITHNGKKQIKQRFNISKKAINSLEKKHLKQVLLTRKQKAH